MVASAVWCAENTVSLYSTSVTCECIGVWMNDFLSAHEKEQMRYPSSGAKYMAESDLIQSVK